MPCMVSEVTPLLPTRQLSPPGIHKLLQNEERFWKQSTKTLGLQRWLRFLCLLNLTHDQIIIGFDFGMDESERFLCGRKALVRQISCMNEGSFCMGRKWTSLPWKCNTRKIVDWSGHPAKNFSVSSFSVHYVWKTASWRKGFFYLFFFYFGSHTFICLRTKTQSKVLDKGHMKEGGVRQSLPFSLSVSCVWIRRFRNIVTDTTLMAERFNLLNSGSVLLFADPCTQTKKAN